MYVKKECGYVLTLREEQLFLKGFFDFYNQPKVQSSKWKHWISKLDFKTCHDCKKLHGQIFPIDEDFIKKPPLHPYCRCRIAILSAIFAGNGTKDGQNGADWWVKHYGALPDYYITKLDIESLGWKPGKSPEKFAPDKMICGGVYQNRNGHLPKSPDRVWYEADINYYSGKRNGHRLLWSNDGLIFVTYDHYNTFCEII